MLISHWAFIDVAHHLLLCFVFAPVIYLTRYNGASCLSQVSLFCPWWTWPGCIAREIKVSSNNREQHQQDSSRRHARRQLQVLHVTQVRYLPLAIIILICNPYFTLLVQCKIWIERGNGPSSKTHFPLPSIKSAYCSSFVNDCKFDLKC